ncbi:hypothetical protein [Nocardia bovistercoris]|nr:hypothetical protein [Nocardia bovistercoris]
MHDNSAPPEEQRSVLTVMPWSVDVLTEWASEIWLYCRRESSAAL